MTKHPQLSIRSGKRACLVAAAVLLLADLCFAATTISLTAKVGPPTTKFQVSGSGFARSAKINIFFDTIVQATITTNSSGSFSKIAIQVPSTALPGNHVVKAVQVQVGTSAKAIFLVRTDWAQFHRSNMQRWNQYENVLNVHNVGNLKLKWKTFAFGGGVEASPAIANGAVYFGIGTNNQFGLKASTGEMLWNLPYFLTGSSSAAVANGVVYNCSWNHDGSVFALNANTGDTLWTYGGGEDDSSPAVVNGVVYVLSWGYFVALDARTGALLWSYGTGGTQTSSSPAVANGVVYVGSGGDFLALNASNGTLLWSFTADSGVNGSPAVANGVVYVGSDSGTVYALNTHTGVKLWSYITGSIEGYGSLGYRSPAVANGVVYVGSDDQNVYALNANTGAKLWSYTTAGSTSSPAVANGVVYVGSFDQNVYALNASTGAKLWSFTTGGPVQSSPAVADGVVYIGSEDSILYAFALN
jgi:outer membrane protein assembly factor BamB